MDDWRNHVGELIGQEVEVVVGDERIVAKVRSITYEVHRGATYEIAGYHKGYQVYATATRIIDEPEKRLRAGGDIDIRLIWQHNVADAYKG